MSRGLLRNRTQFYLRARKDFLIFNELLFSTAHANWETLAPVFSTQTFSE
jgi:hypothetical protein